MKRNRSIRRAVEGDTCSLRASAAGVRESARTAALGALEALLRVAVRLITAQSRGCVAVQVSTCSPNCFS